MPKSRKHAVVRRSGDAQSPAAAAKALPTPNGFERSTLAQAKLERALGAAKNYKQKALAPNTRRAYASDWRIFEAWCNETQVTALPAVGAVVEAFLGLEASEKRRSPSTLRRRLAAIDLVHRGFEYPAPSASVPVRAVMQGIRRDHFKPVQKKAPAMPVDVIRMTDACPREGNRGLRDRAILLFGFATAMRRSELVAIDRSHLEFTYAKGGVELRGVRITIPFSKTDQDREGTTIAVTAEANSDYCPVRALSDWMGLEHVGQPAVFIRVTKADKLLIKRNRKDQNEEPAPKRLTPQSVAQLVKTYAAKVDLDPAQYAGHSFRRGWLTAAAQKEGADLFKMAEHSRHKSMDVLRGYIDDANKFDNHAGAGLLGVLSRSDDES